MADVASAPAELPGEEELGITAVPATAVDRVPSATRGAILSAVEQLLQDRRFDELTVVDLIRAAGVSRGTFYTYFESKHAAVAARAASLMERIHDLWQAWLDAAGADDTDSLRELWRRSIALWRTHQPLLMAAAEAWRADAGVAESWTLQMRGYSRTVERHIERARAEGTAPPEPDTAVLARVLVWMNESALYLAFASSPPEPADDEALAEALVAIWVRSIYGKHTMRPNGAPFRTPDPPPVSPQPLARLRRRANVERRRDLLVATERLLRERPLAAVTATDIIEAAGSSKPTFYMFFESKHAAVAALADELLAAVYDRVWRPSLESAAPDNPPGSPGHFLATIGGWREHSAVLIAAAEGWRTDPVVYARWGERMRCFVAATRAYIEHAREAGSAEPEPDATALAELLVGLTEAIVFQALSGLDPDLDDDVRVASALSAVWRRTVHGRAGA